ncbi:SH3 domain-binding glutamic acid-rich-like protein 2 isoform X4 [Nothobranchius furzeri]|uniref:SH3 domain-binding glutamic acid-rich-like protein 2 isoform X4 n=1 Tax=Nothobranchius furzeri TaxID=105023 RepID=UPI0039048798
MENQSAKKRGKGSPSLLLRLCKGSMTKKEVNPVKMDHRLQAKGPTSSEHLWKLLQDYWKTISDIQVLDQTASWCHPENCNLCTTILSCITCFHRILLQQ